MKRGESGKNEGKWTKVLEAGSVFEIGPVDSDRAALGSWPFIVLYFRCEVTKVDTLFNWDLASDRRNS